jgi:zinc D-Ala-D-Ala carboxypeptidase
MKIATNFYLSEFERSNTADRMGIDNSVRNLHRSALFLTASNLQSLRDWLSDRLGEDTPINITSGYRSPKLNKALSKMRGGVASKSHHLTGHAVDIKVNGLTTEELLRLIIEWSDESGIDFDQLINEHDTWVHLSFAPSKRGQIIKASRNFFGRVFYERIL